MFRKQTVLTISYGVLMVTLLLWLKVILRKPTPHSASDQYLRHNRSKRLPKRTPDLDISPRNLCHNWSYPRRIIFLVPSSLEDFLERQIIRETWGSCFNRQEEPLADTFRLVFILGQRDNEQRKREERRIKKEFHRHKDTFVDANLSDSYQMLTWKIRRGFQWILEHCPQAQVIFKVDQDVFVFVESLLKVVVSAINVNKPQIHGHLMANSYPDRAEDSKWYVSQTEYPNSHYPTYLNGPGYLLTSPALQSIVALSRNSTKLFPMEDVYFTGLLAERLGIPRIGAAQMCQQYLEDYENQCTTIHLQAPSMLWKYKRPWMATFPVKSWLKGVGKCPA